MAVIAVALGTRSQRKEGKVLDSVAKRVRHLLLFDYSLWCYFISALNFVFIFYPSSTTCYLAIPVGGTSLRAAHSPRQELYCC